MNKAIIVATLSAIFASACTSTPDFSDQLKSHFTSHVQKFDSSVVVDSFRIIQIDSLTEKLGQIVYDSIFSREESHLETQLSSARKHKNADSLSFVQYELDYMKKEMDSLHSMINKADTVKKYGVLAVCSFTITKNNKSKTNPVYYFINTREGIMNQGMIDDSIKSVISQLR